MIKSVNDISFPPIGNNKPYLVLLEEDPFAGADSEEHAKRLVEMYSKNVGKANKPSLNSLKRWSYRVNNVKS